jgi:integrase
MTNSLIVPPAFWPATADATRKPDHEGAVREARAAARAANTSRTYSAQIRKFERWCDEHGYRATLPISPALVAAYLSERRRQGVSRSTLAVAYAAILAGHRAEGHRFDEADPELREAREGHSRAAVRPEKQARALTPDLLAPILASVSTPVEARDAMILALLYNGALRRSELSGLDFAEAGEGTGILRLDDQGIEIEFLRSKTSQQASEKIWVAREQAPRAIAALERWVADAGIAPGSPLVRRLTPGGTVTPERLTGDGISNAVKNRVYRYLLSVGTDEATSARLAAAYSGHSGRVGFVTAAKNAGANDSDIATTTRHRSLVMIQRYGKQAEAKRRAVHKLPGVGL